MPKIEINTNAGGGTLKVDGAPLRGVNGFTVRGRVYEATEVTLDLVVFDDMQLCDENATVLIPAATRETLVALGWTPPDGA